jgi:hypothetical protein
MLVYGPADGRDGTWEDQAPRRAMERLLESCEPR